MWTETSGCETADSSTETVSRIFRYRRLQRQGDLLRRRRDELPRLEEHRYVKTVYRAMGAMHHNRLTGDA